jgi:hypothetical protein
MRTLAIGMKKGTLQLWVVAVLVVAGALWIPASSTVNILLAEKCVRRIGHAAILRDCREMILQRNRYANEGKSSDPDCIELNGSSAQDIPKAIRSLNPLDISVYTNRVLIRLHGPPRMMLLGCGDSAEEGNGWRPLTNGLWWYTGAAKKETK